MSKITTSLLQEMVQAAATRLGKQAEYVNSLNVFPVPDGDTGTNMGMTMDNGSKAVADQTASTVGEVGQILSKGMASKSAIRDNFQALLGKENYAKGVVVKSTDAGIAVDVYTVMSYGVKISEVSKNIQERVKFNLENQLGIKTEAVNVYVQNIKVVGEN